MKSTLVALLLLGAAPAVVSAQGAGPAAPPAVKPKAAPITAIGSVRVIYERVKNYVTRSAEQMSEANYAFKPTPEVRSFGQIIGHLVNENYNGCALFSGRADPNKDDFEKPHSKAELVTAIKASYLFCDAGYTGNDASYLVPGEIFGMKMSRMSIAVLTATHNYEHYGNLITYFRLKGMVPPSSQGGQ